MKAVVDRIIEEIAVVLVGEEEIKVDLPLKILPPGTREGTWLKLAIELDEKSTKEQEEKIAKLLDKLKNKTK